MYKKKKKLNNNHEKYPLYNITNSNNKININESRRKKKS